MNSPIYFEIQVTDLFKAKEFYMAVFGWKFIKQEGTPIEYWRIETEGINGGLLQRPAPVLQSQLGTNAYVCSMEVANFDLAAEKIVQLGGKEALPKFAVPGRCWQGYFLDLDGNTFGIFQVDENAS